MTSDFSFIINWWLLFFLLGLSFLPFTTKVFTNFADSGYIFAKILGLAVISYLIWLLGTLHLLPFSQFSSWVTLLLMTAVNLFIATKSRKEFLKNARSRWKLMVFEEILFGTALVFWAYIRAHEPSIHGLEKFMDFGFINSILRSEFFPPRDLWLTPESINYYYFGHLVTAVLTKLSGIPLEITFNLMVAALFALTFVGSFSLGMNLTNAFLATTEGFRASKLFRVSVVAGFLSAFLVTLGGNLHAIYAFTRGFDKYWYPDATRFIPYTIHEFPSYSWVVSDLHGHVLDIPFVLLTIGLLLAFFSSRNYSLYAIRYTLLLAFMLAVMYMTNAWDGLIYLFLAVLIILHLSLKSISTSSQPENQKLKIKNQNYALQFKVLNFNMSFYILHFTFCIILLAAGFFLFTLPFNLNFKPFVSGIGFVRDRSSLYMLAILWGFFYFFAISFLVFLATTEARKKTETQISSSSKNSVSPWLQFLYSRPTDVFVLLLILLSTLLLIFPEVAYVKDIYPLHYRANTMFKLGYQAFIMLSLSSAYIFMRIITSGKNLFVLLFFSSSVLLFIPVAIYPYFGIKSYYNGLRSYQGLNGLTWLKNQYPSDYQAILWLKNNIKGQPVFMEAVGESYTDYARVSVFTGLPTVVGWPVHEWLWRGSYDEAGKRDAEVRRAYETTNLEETRSFLKKYQVQYVFLGTLERQKYPQADFFKWNQLGKLIFQSGQTYVYEIN